MYSPFLVFVSEVQANLSLAGTSKPIQYEAFLGLLKVLRSIRQAGLTHMFTNIFSTHEIWTNVVRNAEMFAAAFMSLDYKSIIMGTVQNQKDACVDSRLTTYIVKLADALHGLQPFYPSACRASRRSRLLGMQTCISLGGPRLPVSAPRPWLGEGKTACRRS